MDIQADWAISHVGSKNNSNKIPFFRSHQIFEGLLGDAPLDISRENMIKMVEEEKTHVITVFSDDSGQLKQGEDVRVTSKLYLRTDPNDMEEDNLGELPEAEKRITKL